MKKIFFTPGPSQLYPTVAKHINQALIEQILSVSHRSEGFQQILERTTDNLRQLLGIPESHKIFFLSSATEAIERIIQNCIPDTSLHFVNGAFSQRFYETALALGKKAGAIEIAWGTGFSKVQVCNYQLPITDSQMLCFTHTETSTGVMIDLEIVYQLKKQYPGKLIAVDVVSSVPDVKLDFRYLDCVFFSVQKGFGLPSGLGVLIVSPQALLSSSHQGEAATLPSSLLYQGGLSLSFPQFQGGVGGGYHSFPSLLKYSQKRQTPETPNVLAIYLLGQVAQDMLKYGLDRIREETSQKAKLLYGFFGSHPEFQPFIRAPGLQSRTIIPINVKKGSTSIIAKLAEQGIVVGTGYQNYRSTQIRIANFPAHTTKHIQKLIRASSAHLV